MTKSIFYTSVGLIYLFAFSSLYIQFPGLLGHNGVLPVDSFMSRVLSHGMSFMEFPSLVMFAQSVKVPEDCLCDFLMLLGIVSSVIIVIGFPNPLLFSLCWLCYLSVYLVGQTFLSFQWDILLLEVGFFCMITSFLQWITRTDCKNLGALVWGYRFLIFKLMLMSGATKLQAGCPTWEKLTALEYHFATQPLPTALAWYSHQLHPLLLRLGVAATLLIELPATLLLVWPQRIPRLWGAALQALLQIMIIAIGNYNFFNLLTLVLLIPVCERDRTSRSDKGVFKMLGFGFETVMVYLFLSYSCWVMFEVNHLSPNATGDWSSWLSQVQILVRPDLDLQGYLTWTSIAGFVLTVVGILSHALRNDMSPMTQSLMVVTTILYIQLSFMTFSSIRVDVRSVFTYPPGQYSIIFAPEQYSRLQSFSNTRLVQSLHLTSSYGLFRRMTGMGTPAPGGHQHGVGGMPPSVVARPEILIEGLNEDDETWYPIHFRYKPGNVSSKPAVAVPHQPRLDWQMWFAALGSYSHNAWLLHFMFKLLAGHCPEVLQLIDEKHYRQVFSSGKTAFPAPVAIRAKLVHYDFTRIDTDWSRGLYPSATKKSDKSDPFIKSRDQHGPWWYEQPGSQKEYLPVTIDKHNPSVHQFLQAHGLPSNPDGRIHYLSIDELFGQCNSGASGFEELLHDSLSSYGVPRPLGKVLAFVPLAIRKCVCHAIYPREALAVVSGISSCGAMQAGAAVFCIVVALLYAYMS